MNRDLWLGNEAKAEIEKELKCCATCLHTIIGFHCFDCYQLSEWKEVEPTKPLKTEDEGTTTNTQGAVDGSAPTLTLDQKVVLILHEEIVRLNKALDLLSKQFADKIKENNKLAEQLEKACKALLEEKK